MKFTPLKMPDVLVVEPTIYQDTRGVFFETYREDLFFQHGITYRFVQDNHSFSLPGVLRGLHYQIKSPQGKLIRVISGEIFDVAVDLRRSSPTFGEWDGIILSAKNKHQLWIPPGFAHGFYAMAESVDVIYKVTDKYIPELERTILWNDPSLNIAWPLRLGQFPVLSEKDTAGKKFVDAEYFD